MHYAEERRKKGGNKIIIVIVISVVIIVAGLAVFLNFDKIKYYFQNGEMPDPDATVTRAPVVTPVPTATPEPVIPVVPGENTVGTRFNPPEGYVRTELAEDSFGAYLRNFPLKAYGTVAKLADGTDNPNAPTEGVLDLDLRKNGLQQCADSIIRLYAEFRYARREFEYITFDLYTTPVFKLDFVTWTGGNRIRTNAENPKIVEWYQSPDATPGDESYSTLRYYLDNVFLYANTYSLKNQMMQVDSSDIQVGDCLIVTADQTGGTDGHAIIIVDVAVNKETGKKVFMLAEGNTPATEMYILKDNENDTVWFSLDEAGTFSKKAADGRTVVYPLDAFRRFKR